MWQRWKDGPSSETRKNSNLAGHRRHSQIINRICLLFVVFATHREKTGDCSKDTQRKETQKEHKNLAMWGKIKRQGDNLLHLVFLGWLIGSNGTLSHPRKKCWQNSLDSSCECVLSGILGISLKKKQKKKVKECEKQERRRGMERINLS